MKYDYSNLSNKAIVLLCYYVLLNPYQYKEIVNSISKLLEMIIDFFQNNIGKGADEFIIFFKLNNLSDRLIKYIEKNKKENISTIINQEYNNYDDIDLIISSLKKNEKTNMEKNSWDKKDNNEISYLCSLLSFERKNIIDGSQINPYLLSLAHRLYKKHIPKTNNSYDNQDIII